MRVSKNVCTYVMLTCVLLFATSTICDPEQPEAQYASAQNSETPQVNVQDAGTARSDQSTIRKTNSVTGTSNIKADGTENTEKQQENQNCADHKNKEAVEFFGKLSDGSHMNFYERDFKNQYRTHFKLTDFTEWTEKIYMANIAFETGDGPVFLVVGGLEEMKPDGLEVAAWYQLAKKFNALIYFIEHRYYGKSILGIDDLSTKNLIYLSSIQTIADIGTFINDSAQSGRKWIVFGKGYGGTIAAWMRVKQPHQVHAAVVFNAPLEARTENKDYYEFFESKFVTAVKKNIKDAYTEMRKAIKENDYGEFRKIFKMCSPLQNNEKNVNFMFWSITTYLAEVVKLKHADPELFRSIMKTLINKDNKNSLDMFGKAVEKILHVLEVPCLAVDYYQALQSYNDTNLDEHKKVYPKALKFGLGIRQTLWLRCSEYGQFETSDGKHTFGEPIKIEFYLGICFDSFNESFNLDRLVERTNMDFGGKKIAVRRVLYISHGDKPWNEIGVTDSIPNKDIVAVKIEAGKSASELLPKYDVIIDNLTRWLKKDVNKSVTKDIVIEKKTEIEKKDSQTQTENEPISEAEGVVT